MKIDLVADARPDFIKFSLMIEVIEKPHVEHVSVSCIQVALLWKNGCRLVDF